MKRQFLLLAITTSLMLTGSQALAEDMDACCAEDQAITNITTEASTPAPPAACPHHAGMPDTRMESNTPCFGQATMSDMNFSSKSLNMANFRKSNLSGANFKAALLTEADFRRANLSGADLTAAQMKGADLRNANLQGANLSGTDLTNANVKGAMMTGAKYNQHTVFPVGFVPQEHGLVMMD